jgi:hypothetical protein
MEEEGVSNRVLISEDTHKLLESYDKFNTYKFDYHKTVEIEKLNNRKIKTYLVS